MCGVHILSIQEAASAVSEEVSFIRTDVTDSHPVGKGNVSMILCRSKLLDKYLGNAGAYFNEFHLGLSAFSY